MSARRTLLFVPGARPDRFEKAVCAGADMVCVDLEDSVQPQRKDSARTAAIKWLVTEGSGPERIVRINSLKTRAGLVDLVAIADASPQNGLIFLPKVDGPDELRITDAILSEAKCPLGMIALIESLDGVENVQAISTASIRLEMIMFGAVDFAAELGCDLAEQPLAYARSRIIHAARRAGISAMDVPCIAVHDHEILISETAAARALGFSGKAVLHPANVKTVNDAFTPTAQETAKAREIVAAFEASETGLVLIDGKLVEKPVIRKMEQVLSAAKSAGLA